METIDLKKIKGDKASDKRVIEVYSLLKRYMEAPERAKWERRRKDSWAAVAENEMWSDEEKAEIYKSRQIPIVVNKLNKGVQGSAAIVTASKPGIEIHPVGSGDLFVADLLKRCSDHIWEKNHASDSAYEGVEEAKVGGLAWWEVRLNRNAGFLGKIEINEVSPDYVYFDAESRKYDFSDTHIIKARLRTRNYIKENYPKLKDDDLEFHDAPPAEETGTQKSEGLTSGDNYAESPKDDAPASWESGEKPEIWEIEAWLLKTIREVFLVVVDQQTGEAEQHLLDPSMVIEQGEQKRILRPDAEGKLTEVPIDNRTTFLWERVGEKRVLRLVVGKKLMPQRNRDNAEVMEWVNPYGEDSDGEPVMPLIGLRHNKTLSGYPTSPTFFALPINKEKNKARMQYTHAISHNTNAPIGWMSGKVKWTGPPGTPGSTFVYDQAAGQMPVMRLPGGAVDLGLIVQREQMADSAIDDQYDLYDVMRGKLNPGEDKPSGRMVLALQDMAGTMSKPFVRRLESALVRLAKATLSIALEYWPRSQWERLLEPKEKPGWQPKTKEEMETVDEQSMMELARMSQGYQQALEAIRPNDPERPAGISMLDLDVKITAGSSMPTNRMAKEEIAIEKYKVQLYDRRAALEYAEDPKAEEIARRMAKQEEAAMAAAAEKAMNKAGAKA